MFITLLFTALTATIHYYIFYLERLQFGSPRFQQVFSITENDLPTVQAAFHNLAIYNLAVAIFATLGILLNLFYNGLNDAGKGMIFAALGTASIAGIYLAATQANKRRAAAIQAAPAIIGLIALIF